MLLCFTSSVVLAIGHHVLNLCLASKVVAELPVNQQWVSRGENALAYLVKVLLVLATGTAYFQCVWHNARGRPTKISHFDSMFGALDNIVVLRHVRFWYRKPVLAMIVIVIWLIPLIAIVTPGTLSVVRASISQPATISVQQRDYGSGLYAASIQADNGSVFYGGARSYLKGPTLATLVETEILSVGTFATNLTYSLDFYGPAVSCSKADNQIVTQLTEIITKYQDKNKTSLMYDVWVPKPDLASNATTLVDGSLVVTSDTNQNLRMLDQTSADAARIYYTLAPDVSVQANMSNPVNVIQCALYNASWHLDFDVRSTGEQRLNPTVTFENWMPGWSSTINSTNSSSSINSIDIMTSFDYAGLMETFGSLTSGKLEVPQDPNLPFTQTSLALETSPLLFAAATPDPFTDEASVQLQQTLESLFRNMTLSARYAVLPQQSLRGDTSMLTFTKVNATSTFFRNVYAYDARDLLLAYGFALAGGAVCVCLAMLAVRDMHAVYTNSFSTAVRVSRAQSRLDNVIRDDRDRSGAQPLPKRIADAYIWVAKDSDPPKVGMGMGRGRIQTVMPAAESKEVSVDSPPRNRRPRHRQWWRRWRLWRGGCMQDVEIDQEKNSQQQQQSHPVMTKKGPIVVLVSQAGLPRAHYPDRTAGGWI
ncbi:hypothetical protein ABEF93_002634 [Exophiala dermatitidis]